MPGASRRHQGTQTDSAPPLPDCYDLFRDELVEMKGEFTMELSVDRVLAQERSQSQTPDTEQPREGHGELRRSGGAGRPRMTGASSY